MSGRGTCVTVVVTCAVAEDGSGPLPGLRILEVAGLGAAPFCGMVHSDPGADVIRVGRASEVETGGGTQALLGLSEGDPAANVLDRGRRAFAVDLKDDAGRQLVRPPRGAATGAIELRFYAELLDRVGLDADVAGQWDRAEWPAMQQVLTGIFAQRTLAAWCEVLEGTGVCFAPVLSLEEAPGHPHDANRGTFTQIPDVVQPAPAPRFSRTRTACPRPDPPPTPGRHTREVLAELGWTRTAWRRCPSEASSPGRTTGPAVSPAGKQG